MRAVKYGEKFASFSPEDNPPEEYYHDFVEMLLGCNCTPANPNRPTEEVYSTAYDFVSEHIFYLYPKELTPTPQYIKECFLELIVKEKISGCVIDPFNQLTHNYKESGGARDLYLETILGDLGRFASQNNLPVIIVAHPVNPKELPNGNFPMPNRNHLAGGAMWGNKMDNIIVYHRPVGEKEPDNPLCSFASKKIRREKVVGRKGEFDFTYQRASRRFKIDEKDYLQEAIER